MRNVVFFLVISILLSACDMRATISEGIAPGPMEERPTEYLPDNPPQLPSKNVVPAACPMPRFLGEMWEMDDTRMELLRKIHDYLSLIEGYTLDKLKNDEDAGSLRIANKSLALARRLAEEGNFDFRCSIARAQEKISALALE